jgi:hypothetical protein
MPISAIDSCSEDHWRDVKGILFEAIEDADFSPQLVSDADDVGIIQKRIIQNLYENPIVVCDVSAKNPNVMFELGMRLAFDRPTIIVKDDKTSYSFDTSPIEHLTYPRDLRFSKIVEFKESLTEKIQGTHEKAQNNKNYTTFLKNFGTFKVAELQTEVVSQEALIMDEIKSLRQLVAAAFTPGRATSISADPPTSRILCMNATHKEVEVAFVDEARVHGIEIPSPSPTHNGHLHFRITAPPGIRNAILSIAKKHSAGAKWLGTAPARTQSSSE